MPVKPHTAMLSKSSPRYSDWMKVFGDGVVPIQSPSPVAAELPIGKRSVYLVALDQLSVEQRARLTAHLAHRFGVPPEEVAKTLEDEGLPILADDLTIAIDFRFFS